VPGALGAAGPAVGVAPPGAAAGAPPGAAAPPGAPGASCAAAAEWSVGRPDGPRRQHVLVIKRAERC
jgi:hypothetical protein